MPVSKALMVAVALLAILVAFAIPALRRADAPADPTRVSQASPQTRAEPRRIAGGNFEASGLTRVPGTSRFVFVDDGRERDIFLMDLSPDGRQQGEARRVPIAANVTDMEGLTTDGAFVYAVGSQSKRTGFEGDGLIRFRVDANGTVTGVERARGLKAWLARNVAELRGTERQVDDEVLNIEGLAWDPRNRRLLLGLRAPLVDGSALIVPVRLRDTTVALTESNLAADGAAIRLALDGAGVRAIEFDDETGTFLVISGAALDDETADFRILEWNGAPDGAPREIGRFDRSLKPEGIVRARLGDVSVRVVVFDTGYYTVLH